jgi:hypothetical protein
MTDTCAFILKGPLEECYRLGGCTCVDQVAQESMRLNARAAGAVRLVPEDEIPA